GSSDDQPVRNDPLGRSVDAEHERQRYPDRSWSEGLTPNQYVPHLTRVVQVDTGADSVHRCDVREDGHGSTRCTLARSTRSATQTSSGSPWATHPRPT